MNGGASQFVLLLLYFFTWYVIYQYVWIHKKWSSYNLQFWHIFSDAWTCSILHLVYLNSWIRSSLKLLRKQSTFDIIQALVYIFSYEFCMYILAKMIPVCKYRFCYLLFQPLTIYWAIRLATLKSWFLQSVMSCTYIT